LPVSVKTRLGYSYVDEWREWLATLLQQDIAALTIHLRTKREMSKVPAHHELIPDIKKLRDELAPGTLLIINGDIRDRTHGLELTEQYGVDGVMIGRGVFQNPFCFAKIEGRESQNSDKRVTRGGAAPTETASTDNPDDGADRKKELINLLRYHLDLFDKWQPELQRPFDTLKRFFKIYIRDFDGASDLRDKLMHTASTDEVREIIYKL
jgi:tRNA-dihydrouridine synthase